MLPTDVSHPLSSVESLLASFSISTTTTLRSFGSLSKRFVLRLSQLTVALDPRSLMATRGDSSPVYHAPTISPGLGAPRCPRCAAPLSKDLEASGWTIAPFMRESFAVVGTAVGGSVGAFYGFNHIMPPVHKHVKGPLWLQFLVGLPPVMLFSVACAGLSGGALPAFAQLAVSTYHSTSASSHAAISQLTMNVEGQQEPVSFARTIAQAKDASQPQSAAKQGS